LVHTTFNTSALISYSVWSFVVLLLQLVSGKAGDDTKGPDRDKAKELLELSKIAKQKASSASGPSVV